ncbi:hypothetical protein EW145_g5409, partial [Phellinidium pouzarii]
MLSLSSTVKSSLATSLRRASPAGASAAFIRCSSSIPVAGRSLSPRTSSRPSPSPSLLAPAHARSMSALAESAERPAPDKVLVDIADYIHGFTDYSPLALDTARLCLIDTIGCGLEALRFEHCRRLLGPVVEGTIVPNGTKVPGTNYQLDPIRGAFNIGTIIRWLDFNDCFLAAEWGHPSDNLGAILAVADH